jgi:hypothetical protein
LLVDVVRVRAVIFVRSLAWECCLTDAQDVDMS